jgi:hypothetical protein
MAIPRSLRRSWIGTVPLCRDVTARDRGRSVGACDIPRDDPFFLPRADNDEHRHVAPPKPAQGARRDSGTRRSRVAR